MSIITGKQYIERIDKLNTNVWIDGSRVTGKISTHPAFKGVMKSQATLYDLQHENTAKALLTYPSPLTGEHVGISFLQPKTAEDLVKRRLMVQQWAKVSYGMMGRSPDYMNTVLTALASSADFLQGKENCFPDHVRAFYELAREQDLSITHTFIDPQVNRSNFYFEDGEKPIAAKIVDQNEHGIIIKGAKLLATQGGITDELIVMSRGSILEEEKAYAFAIPSNSEGLKFICRESFVSGESTFNYPLSARFEEMDCLVVFDHVLVPWERVFYFKNTDVADNFMVANAFKSFSLHQVASRQIIKTEFILGVAESIVREINIGGYLHVQEKVSEIIVALETMKALVLKSEIDAKLDEWGYLRPELPPLQVAITIYPRIYPRFTDIIQLLGASGLMAIPTENDFNSAIRGDLDHYLQSKSNDAEQRVKLYRLAWDLTMSPFGTRQTLYERFFFGDPVKVSSELYHTYDKERYVQSVTDLLLRSEDAEN